MAVDVITAVDAAAYGFPSPAPRSDGTLEWNRTVMLAAWIYNREHCGFGYSYCSPAAATLIRELLAPHLIGEPPGALPRLHARLRQALRNNGNQGLGAMALSALDVALWDLRGKQLGVSLTGLLGSARDAVDCYASGGFCSQSLDELAQDVDGWLDAGFRRIKIKVGRDLQEDRQRVARLAQRLGSRARLMVDANGALLPFEALDAAVDFHRHGVDWFEEPLSSDAVEELARLRRVRPPGIAIAAGEYAWRPMDLLRLLRTGAVDVAQADATRCGGVSGFMACAELCDAFGLRLSSHCAPALHAALCCAAPAALHLEYFQDHADIEARYLDGCTTARDGRLPAQRERPGLGLTFKRADAESMRLQ